MPNVNALAKLSKVTGCALTSAKFVLPYGAVVAMVYIFRCWLTDCRPFPAGFIISAIYAVGILYIIKNTSIRDLLGIAD